VPTSPRASVPKQP